MTPSYLFPSITFSLQTSSGGLSIFLRIVPVFPHEFSRSFRFFPFESFRLLHSGNHSVDCFYSQCEAFLQVLVPLFESFYLLLHLFDHSVFDFFQFPFHFVGGHHISLLDFLLILLGFTWEFREALRVIYVEYFVLPFVWGFPG